ncbi:viral A-type inclusion protein [Clostridium taeniosporum]|uniref:Viral A-type inclusion protein n=1 Tax=Clostridium taeniosporum TaxID=394958 RepID=A0A1D7XGR4_9CLOT|nr:viral A-type inclusion protein [Clostridium taeniosporum]AOR22280.1 viral A-type inclusion protein [Clostridium taeniosporum]
MKKRIFILVFIIIIVLLSVIFINKMNTKTQEEQFSYRLEYVKSLDDIDKSKPTVIFFKGLINKEESLEYEIMLKELKNEINFNLVHISLDYVTTDEQKNIIDKYNVTRVPMIVVKDKNQNDVETYYNITYEKLKELINKLS